MLKGSGLFIRCERKEGGGGRGTCFREDRGLVGASPHWLGTGWWLLANRRLLVAGLLWKPK